MRQDDVNEQEYAKPENWRGGPLGLYASERDDRAFVPKRHGGLGVTPNLATGTGLGFMIGVLVFVGVLSWSVASIERRASPPGATATER